MEGVLGCEEILSDLRKDDTNRAIVIEVRNVPCCYTAACYQQEMLLTVISVFRKGWRSWKAARMRSEQ